MAGPTDGWAYRWTVTWQQIEIQKQYFHPSLLSDMNAIDFDDSPVVMKASVDFCAFSESFDDFFVIGCD